MQELKQQKVNNTFLLDKQGRPVDAFEKQAVIFRCLMSGFFRRLKIRETAKDFQNIGFIAGGDKTEKEIRKSMSDSIRKIRGR